MICVIDVKSGPAKGKRIWLRDTEHLQVGRHSDAHLSIPSDPHLSRHHVLIEGVSGKFRARDLGSANGTFLNRAEISVVELLDGDQLQVGSTILSLSFIPNATKPHAGDEICFGAFAGSNSEAPMNQPIPIRQVSLAERLARECSEQSSGALSSGIQTPVSFL